MDANKIVKVCLLGAQLDHPTIALGHLSCIGAQVVEANHLLLHRRKGGQLINPGTTEELYLAYLLGLDTDQLGIARILRPMSDGPLQWPEVGVIHLAMVTSC